MTLSKWSNPMKITAFGTIDGPLLLLKFIPTQNRLVTHFGLYEMIMFSLLQMLQAVLINAGQDWGWRGELEGIMVLLSLTQYWWRGDDWSECELSIWADSFVDKHSLRVLDCCWYIIVMFEYLLLNERSTLLHLFCLGCIFVDFV